MRSMKKILTVGIAGVGHLGKIHLNCLKELEKHYKVIGVYDIDVNTAKEVAAAHNIKCFSSREEMIEAVDVLDIVTPTLSHFDFATAAMRRYKHVFIEKPVTQTVKEARKLLALQEEAEVQVQVGHVERFNPAFTAVKDIIDEPGFIESHRLAEFNPRGTDVSVVLDLMIHDIDIILSTVKSEVKKINASGVAVISDTPDICNARIEFTNGCTANLTASRISLKNMRKTRIFQREAYIAVDFLERQAEVVTMTTPEGEPDPLAVTIEPGNGKKPKTIHFDKPSIKPVNAIKEELRTFAEAIDTGKKPVVTLEDGMKALEVAHQILNKLEVSPHFLNS